MAKKFYAYFFNNFHKGIVDTWDECKNIVQNSKARYKAFKSFEKAEQWLDSGAEYNSKQASNKILTSLEEGVYFDAGTGRGRGVEVRITDKNGKSLIHILEDDNFNKFLKKNSWFINEFDNIELGKKKTNNFGELLAFYFALECAQKLNLKKVFGDSQLIITYWTKGIFNGDSLPETTVSLILKATKNRKNFELSGASIEHISGSVNPADLGFHK